MLQSKIPFFQILLVLALFCMSLLHGQVDLPKTVDPGFSNLGITPNNANTLPQVEYINPKNAVEGFEKALQKKQQKQLQKQELEDLKYKGILTAAQIHKKRLKAEMDELNKPFAKVDQDLGGFSSQSKQITIFCRDFAYADGDLVTIYLNNTQVVRNIELTESYQKFTLPLQVGLNKLSFKALNQGSSGPNTAAFVIFDDKGNVLSSNEWNLATGAKAFLSVVRDY